MEDTLDAWRARALASEHALHVAGQANAALQERIGALEAELHIFYNLANSSSKKMKLCATASPIQVPSPLQNWQNNGRAEPLSDATERDREYIAVLERLRTAASARMHHAMGLCCLDVAGFLSIYSISCLRFVSKDMNRKMMHARTSSWGILQLHAFGEGDLLIKNLLRFLSLTNHEHVRVQVKEGIGVTGFLARGYAFQDYQQIYNGQYDLPLVQSFSLVNTSKAILLQRDLPYRAELEVLSKMQNLKHVQFVRLSLADNLVRALSAHCPRVETFSMIHCKGNQDNPLTENGSFLKDFQKLREVHMDFHSHGSFQGWPGLRGNLFLGEALDRLEVISVRGNMQNKLTSEDYERILSRTSKLKELRISPWPGCSVALEESLCARGSAMGIKVVFCRSKCDKEFPITH